MLTQLLFISHYSKLKNILPKWYKLNVAWVLILVVFPYLFEAAFHSKAVKYLMILILVWIPIILIPLLL